MSSHVEFCLNAAHALLPDLEKAAVFVNRALTDTVDQRLRFLLLPAVAAISRNDAKAAAKWLDQAINYAESCRHRKQPTRELNEN
jgi:hypothetical protein